MPTLTFDRKTITSRAKLKGAIGLALRADEKDRPGMRTFVETRARQLDAEDLLPDPAAWTSKPATTAPPAPPKPTDTSTVLLDQPPAALMTPEHRGDLDRATRALMAEREIPYDVALDRLSSAIQGQPTVRAALTRAGLLEPEGGLRMLELGDRAQQRMLDAGAPGADVQLDAQGRVRLDRADARALLHAGDSGRDDRWERAKELSSYYARADRQVFEDDDRMLLEGDVDIVRTLELEQPAEIARQRATQVAGVADAVLATGRRAARQVRELDTAAEALAGERARIAGGSSASTRTLDRPDAPPTHPKTFVELSGDDMVRAIEAWENAEKRISLDDAAAQITGSGLGPGPEIPQAVPQPQLADTQLGPRGELHDRIVAYCKEHDCTYAEALQAITGVGLSRIGGAL